MILKNQFSRCLLSCLCLCTFFFLCHYTVQGEIPSGYLRTKNNTDKNYTIQKVINAMLSMQRRAWEHGVASQALAVSKTDG
jgi:hypothetical protein